MPTYPILPGDDWLKLWDVCLVMYIPPLGRWLIHCETPTNPHSLGDPFSTCLGHWIKAVRYLPTSTPWRLFSNLVRHLLTLIFTQIYDKKSGHYMVTLVVRGLTGRNICLKCTVGHNNFLTYSCSVHCGL